MKKSYERRDLFFIFSRIRGGEGKNDGWNDGRKGVDRGRKWRSKQAERE